MLSATHNSKKTRGRRKVLDVMVSPALVLRTTVQLRQFDRPSHVSVWAALGLLPGLRRPRSCSEASEASVSLFWVVWCWVFEVGNVNS